MGSGGMKGGRRDCGRMDIGGINGGGGYGKGLEMEEIDG